MQKQDDKLKLRADLTPMEREKVLAGMQFATLAGYLLGKCGGQVGTVRLMEGVLPTNA
jgi:hypothetical protein